MKVRLLTSMAGTRPTMVRDTVWEFDEEAGTSEQVQREVEKEEGYVDDAGSIQEFDADTCKRLIDAGIAEAVKSEPRPRRQAKPKAEKATAEPKSEKASAPPKAEKATAEPKSEKASSPRSRKK